jgi:hypothetical protein
MFPSFKFRLARILVSLIPFWSKRKIPVHRDRAERGVLKLMDSFRTEVADRLTIDLLQRVGSIVLVLAVISLFVCTIPVWLIALVVLLFL